MATSEPRMERVQIEGEGGFVVLNRVERIKLRTPSGQPIELTVDEEGKVLLTSDGKPVRYTRRSLKEGKLRAV